MKHLNVNMNETEISLLSKNQFKKHVQICAMSTSYEALRVAKEEHIKINHINFNNFNLQPYLSSDLFNHKEAFTLFNMRANTVNSFKKCFPSSYQNNIKWKLGCSSGDTINHIFQCTNFGPPSEIRYDDIFGTTVQQIGAVSEYLQRCSQRSALLADRASQGLQG